MSRARSLVLMLAAAVAVACSGGTGDTMVGVKKTGAGGDSGQAGGGGGGGHDTTVHVDSVVGSPAPGIHGRVWGAVPTTDTSIYVGVPGATVEIFRQASDSSGVVSEPLVATAATDAAGLYLVNPIADGTYRARATPPASSPYAAGTLLSIVVKQGRMTSFTEANIYVPRK